MYYAVCAENSRFVFEKWFKPSEFANFEHPAKAARDAAYADAKRLRNGGARARVEKRDEPEPEIGCTGWAEHRR